MREDIRVSMPPNTEVHDGREAMRPLVAKATAMGEWRLVPDAREPDAVRGLLPAPAGRHGLPRVQARRAARRATGGIAEITTFGSALFGAFGLPDELADVARS